MVSGGAQPQTVERRYGGIFQMQDSSRDFRSRFRRRVDEERSHDHDATAFERACNAVDASNRIANLFVAQHAQCVSSGQHSQRSVV